MEQIINQNQNSLRDLVGKTIVARVKDEKRIKQVVGEVVQGKIKISYICDQGMNAIGCRQEKVIKLKEGEEIYLACRNNSGKITAFWKLYPILSPTLIGIGAY